MRQYVSTLLRQGDKAGFYIEALWHRNPLKLEEAGWIDNLLVFKFPDIHDV